MTQQLVRSFCLSLIFALLCLGLADARSDRYEAVDYGGESILTRGPEVVGFKGSSAVLEFYTAVPTPPALVHYGVVLVEEELAFPRLRKKARERLPEGESMTTSHRVRIDVASLESPMVETGLVESKGGHVEYRIELYDPEASTVRYFDSRFCYKREGEPGTGLYSKSLTILEGPFVDIVTHDSAVISWRTDDESSGSVVVDGREFIADQVSECHEVYVSGLDPGTRYAYRVRYSSQRDETREYSFRTAPTPGSRQRIKIGYLGDSREGVGGGEQSLNGVNAKDLAGFTAALYRQGADLICFGGDLVDGYTSSLSDFKSQLRTWKKVVQPVASLIPIYEAMGNHEQVGDYFKVPREGSPYLVFTIRPGNESTEAVFGQEFVSPTGSAYGFPAPAPEDRAPGVSGPEKGPTYSENVYSFNYGNVHVLAANSSYWYTGQIHGHTGDYEKDWDTDNLALRQLGGNREGYIRENQLAWIGRDLEAAQDDPDIDWVIVIVHEPPFPNGGHVEDAMYWGRKVDGKSIGYNDAQAPLGDVVDMRDRLWRTLVNHDKVLLVLAGDEHNYSRTLIDSTVDPDYRSSIWQITSGGCGAPYYGRDDSVPWAANVRRFARSKHCCILTVEGKRVSLEVLSDTGGLLDSVDDLASVRPK